MTAAPDLIVAGRVATLSGDHGPGWAEAVAVRRGRVVAAGARSEVEALAGARTRSPDEVVVPGLTDAHLHLASAALARRALDLSGADAIEVLVEWVRAFAAARPDEAWIEGGGWDADSLGRWPTADDLERAAPGRRIALWAHDHHALLASARALAEAGLDDVRGDPDGGVIRRREGGGAAGVLHETAARLVADRIPASTPGDLAGAIEALSAELVSLGVVAVHDPGGLTRADGLGGPVAAYRAMAAAARLRQRVHVCVRPEQLDAALGEGLRAGAPLGEDPLGRLRLGWLKTFADGTLGSRTAALLEPLHGPPDEPPPPNRGYGVWLTPPAELRAQAVRAAAGGVATQIHAIGDGAVRAALDALAGTAGATPLMPRVEHVQLLANADLPRFAALGIAASMQPVHVRSDAAKARLLWGARADERAYALGALARSGAVLAAGTDAPVEPVDPWPGVACAVTRSAPDWTPGTPPFGAVNALDLWTSLRAWCVGPAVAAGEPDRGRLVAGARADLVVLPAAALVEPVEAGGALWRCRPRLVLMDGEVVAER